MKNTKWKQPVKLVTPAPTKIVIFPKPNGKYIEVPMNRAERRKAGIK
jgi:hypothetical protein